MADKKSEDPSKIFTYDPENEGETEAPSLTRLLNRKSLTQKKTTGPSASGTQTKTPAPSQPPSPPQITPPLPPSPPQAAEKKDAPSIEIELSDPSTADPSLSSSQTPSLAPETSTPSSQPQDIANHQPSLNEGGIEIEGLESQPLQTQETAEASAPQENLKSNEISAPSESLSLQTEIPLENSANLPEGSSSAQTPHSQSPIIRTAPKPSSQNPAPEIKTWDLEQLSQNPDPLGKAIIEMSQRGTDCALFLSITPPEGSSTAPFFRATAGIHSEKRIPLWRGIQWKPELFKDLWNAFLKSGQIELGPTSTQSASTPAKNAMRAALGTLPSEWLILVRVGSPQSCRGVIAFFSKQSLLSELAHVLPLLNSDLPK